MSDPAPESRPPLAGRRRKPGGCILPLFESSVPAGFPSPAEDHMEGGLDLNELMVRHPTATFFVRAAGDSMTGAGIHSGDILVVDKSLAPEPGNIVIAEVDGEFTVKRLRRDGRTVWLMPENEAFDPIVLGDGADLRVWGVVTFVVHRV